MFVINLHDGISGLYKTYLIDEEIEDDDAIYFEFF